MHKTTGEGWNTYSLFILVLNTQLCVLKTTDEVWDPVQTCKTGPKVAVLHAQNHRWGLGPIETSNSGANPDVLHAQNDRWCLGPLEICYSGPKHAVLHTKATGEGWNQYSLFILVLSSQLCVLKTTDEVWDP